MPATAQVPNTLLHDIPAPLVGALWDAQLGYSVAVEGDYKVVGAAFDDRDEFNPGVTYEVQSAATLFSANTTTVLINKATTLKMRDNTLISTLPARFMRVQVTAAP